MAALLQSLAASYLSVLSEVEVRFDLVDHHDAKLDFRASVSMAFLFSFRIPWFPRHGTTTPLKEH